MHGFLLLLSWKLYSKSCIRVETKSMFQIRLLCIEISKMICNEFEMCLCSFYCAYSFACLSARSPESLPTNNFVTKFVIFLLLVSTVVVSAAVICSMKRNRTWAVFCHRLNNNSMLVACSIYTYSLCFPLLLIGFICNSSLERTSKRERERAHII